MSDVVFSVSQINDYLSRKIQTDLFLSKLFIMGEVTNFSMSPVGHAFFSLKDEGGMIDCIIYDYLDNEETDSVKDGEKILAAGKVTYYKRSGSVQFAIISAKPQGIGDLYARFERTKAKLKEEGIFDSIYKKPLPLFPCHIGVVTSASGAAVHDIINVATRRFEGIRITIYPARVQGEGAAQEIAAGIGYFNEYTDADVLIVGRGGGSFEDLFAFNEEVVARKVFESRIPVISAVGHETDFSLCDMAADLRAPTPSAAAELAVKDKSAVVAYIEDYISRLSELLQRTVRENDNRLLYCSERIINYPVDLRLEQTQDKISSLSGVMRLNLASVLERKQLLLDKLCGSLYDLDPKNILKRGYAIIYDENQNIITSAKSEEKDMQIEFKDGRVSVRRKA